MRVKDYDIFILGQSRWDNPYSSLAFCLAKEFSKNNRVFYIDHPFSIKDLVKDYNKGKQVKSRLSALVFGQNSCRKVEGLPQNFNLLIPNITLPINWLKSGWLYNLLSKLNDRILSITFKKTIKKYQVKKYIFINSFDPYFFRSFPKAIAPTINIYQSVDDISQESYIARHGIRLEREALMKADISFTTSKELTRLMRQYTNKVYCLPNAADFSLFQTAVNQQLEKPKELIGITQKVICYTGVIGTRINFELLQKVALSNPDKLLLMVGPRDANAGRNITLDTLPNVIFTGQKNITELPAYLQYTDCAIIPFAYSVLTKSIYPLKINEYLTAGKPVVTTAFSEDIIDFKDVAYVSETDEDFLQNIEKAIREDGTEKQQLRISTAQKNTWEARVEQFWKYLELI